MNLLSRSGDWIFTPRSAEPKKIYSGNGGAELNDRRHDPYCGFGTDCARDRGTNQTSEGLKPDKLPRPGGQG
ncbi:hypothetical protein GCM10007989_13780 [Devosia pacifica]|jgi:hypothetical protein|uniref:Uncharacterized protein n=1 Tax=Devosia pacifica TaxID=1335967 RepID=A0A918VS62_9HYPH|nr:hypothetical protein GCM10007989_13780 [Devosia pacifica]